MNSFFLRFSFASIRAHPLAYLRHVSAHFYGMWRDLSRSCRCASQPWASVTISDPQGDPEINSGERPHALSEPDDC